MEILYKMKLNPNVYITIFVWNFGPAEQYGRTILISFIRAVIKYDLHIWVGQQAVIVIHVWLWVIVYNVTPVGARQGLWCFTLKLMWIRNHKHLNLIAKMINAYRPTLQWFVVDNWLKCNLKTMNTVWTEQIHPPTMQTFSSPNLCYHNEYLCPFDPLCKYL